jgi:hypothetical protein
MGDDTAKKAKKKSSAAAVEETSTTPRDSAKDKDKDKDKKKKTEEDGGKRRRANTTKEDGVSKEKEKKEEKEKEKKKKDKKDKKDEKENLAESSAGGAGEAAPVEEEGAVEDALSLLGIAVPPADLPWTDVMDDDLISKQQELLAMVLEARLLMQQITSLQSLRQNEELEQRRLQEREEKKRAGKLTITEIQELLKSMTDDGNFDWVTEMQKLREELAVEIRNNQVLERKAQKLDKRIGLLIRNRAMLADELDDRKAAAKKKTGEPDEPRFVIEQRRLEYYQELFYLLQTEPRYLAKALYLIQAEEMDSFLETTILTLYGDAFSPREEFLILRLFKLSVQNEIAKIRSLSEFLKADSVIPKMLVTYNRRKLGTQYLRQTIGPLLLQVMERTDLNLELNPVQVYHIMINELETRTGVKSALQRDVAEDDAMRNPDVKAILKKRLDVLQEICQMFLDAIVNSMEKLPYGLRYICKTIKEISLTRFGEQLDPEQVLKVVGYFVYYRFINVAIITPDQHKVVEKDLSMALRKNLVVVGKVLQNLFNLRTFGETGQDRFVAPLNPWIEKQKELVGHYFQTLVKVDDPEDFLQITRYNELTQKTKPVIQISVSEITNTHCLLLDNLDALAENKDDELRQILTDLGDRPPVITEDSSNNRELQLTLTNRFKVAVDEDDAMQRLYAETRELVIPVLRSIPVETSIHRLYLMEVLESGIKFAQEKGNVELSKQIERILGNISQLEEAGLLSRADKYHNFVQEISIEVANRNAVREQQKREVTRLSGTLDDMRKHHTYMTEQIDFYKQYLQNAKTAYHAQPGGKKSKDSAFKPISLN